MSESNLHDRLPSITIISNSDRRLQPYSLSVEKPLTKSERRKSQLKQDIKTIKI